MILVLSAFSFILFLIVQRKRHPHHHHQHPPPQFTLNDNNKIDFFTELRSMLMIATCVAILAVDFTIFPRRFAKTEMFGTSLMDLGVGCVVFTNAIVSSTARVGGGGRGNTSETSLRKMFLSALKSVAVLIVIGSARLVSTIGADYHTHVSEYGVHWNFFFTLAFVALFSSLLVPLVSFSSSSSSSSNKNNTNHTNDQQTSLSLLFLLALIVACAYEFLLKFAALQDFVLAAENVVDRTRSLWHANREGISSAVGYLSIYLFGVAVGKLVFQHFQPPQPQPQQHQQQKKKALSSPPSKAELVLKIALLDLTFWIATILIHTSFSPISRRLANLSYILFVVASSLLVLLFFMLASFLLFSSSSLVSSRSIIRDSVARNQLAFFLVANLATGLVNISMNTIDSPAAISMLVLTTYMTLICSFVVFLHIKKISLKFW